MKESVKFIVAISSIIVVFFVIFVGFWFIITIVKNNADEQIYVLSEFNSDTNARKKQIVRLPRNQEHLSFRNEKGNYVTITNSFGSDEYECLGTCYCGGVDPESDDFSRRSIPLVSKLPILRKGMLFLISAVSATMAVQYASDYFKDECSLKFSDSCPEEQLFSDVENCRYLSSMNDEIEFETDMENSDGKEEMLREFREEARKKGEKEDKWYECDGRCVNKVDLLSYILVTGDKDVVTESVRGQLSVLRNLYANPELRSVANRIQCDSHTFNGHVKSLNPKCAVFEYDHLTLGRNCKDLGLTVFTSGRIEKQLSVCVSNVNTIKCKLVDNPEELDIKMAD